MNQNQTYRAELDGGYVWSLKRNKNGARNQFYENMSIVSPGDLIFSFRNQKIGAIGVVTSNCDEVPKPDEFGAAGQNWERVGWRADVAYTEVANSITPKERIEVIRPLLPDKYSPLQQTGAGLQSVYLAELGDDLANLLRRLLEQAGNEIPATSITVDVNHADSVRLAIENHLAIEIQQSPELEETEKEQLIKSRRGQGRFRDKVRDNESRCRLGGFDSRSRHCV